MDVMGSNPHGGGSIEHYEVVQWVVRSNPHGGPTEHYVFVQWVIGLNPHGGPTEHYILVQWVVGSNPHGGSTEHYVLVQCIIPLVLFHPSQCSTTGVMSCLWVGAFKRALAAN